MKVVKPQCLVFQAAPFQIGEQTCLAAAVGLGFRLSDPRIVVHETEIWSALDKAGVPAHSQLQTHPKLHAEWLLIGHAAHRCRDVGQAAVEWEASVRLGDSSKAIRCQHPVTSVNRQAGDLHVALRVDHANSTRGAWRQNPVGTASPNPPLQAAGRGLDPWSAMGPLEPTWTARRQFLPRGGQLQDEWCDATRGPAAWPSAMDLRYFQHAEPHQWSAAGAWQPDESFELMGFAPHGARGSRRLPGLAPRLFETAVPDSGRTQELRLTLKTVLFLPDQDLGLLWWQGATPRACATQVPPVSMTLALDTQTPSRSAVEILGFANKRIDPAHQDPGLLSDAPLMPPPGSGVAWEIIAALQDHPHCNPERLAYDDLQHRMLALEDALGQARRAHQAADANFLALAQSPRLPRSHWVARGPHRWREVLRGPVRDGLLNAVTLRDEDLSGLHLSNWMLRGVRLERCNLRDTRWSGCLLDSVTFVDCDLAEATMTDLTVQQSRWIDSDMQGLTVQGGHWAHLEWRRCRCDHLRVADVHWQHAVMDRTRGAAACLHRVEIGNWVLTQCDAAHWQIIASRLDGLSLVDVNMSSLHLDQTSVMNLSGVRTDFEGSLMARARVKVGVLALGCSMDFVTLEDCVWERCTWTGITAAALSAVHCSFVSFCAADSNLEGSRWHLSDLSQADFNGACLVGAAFERCSLRHATLMGADLAGAQVQGCNLVGAQLQWAIAHAGSSWHGNRESGTSIHPRRAAA